MCVCVWEGQRGRTTWEGGWTLFSTFRWWRKSSGYWNVLSNPGRLSWILVHMMEKTFDSPSHTSKWSSVECLFISVADKSMGNLLNPAISGKSYLIIAHIMANRLFPVTQESCLFSDRCFRGYMKTLWACIWAFPSSPNWNGKLSLGVWWKRLLPDTLPSYKITCFWEDYSY